MLSVVQGVNTTNTTLAKADIVTDMWRDRKTVFVDTLGWDVPVVEDCFEIDQFDDEHAVYLIVSDRTRSRHLASVRLLPSERPHILGDIFPQLCAGPVPRDVGTWEITRLCLSPSLGSVRQAMLVRRELALGLIEYALANGIDRYTQVHLVSHLSQLLAVGWDCEPLGFPVDVNGQSLMASAIAISPAALDAVQAQAEIRRRVIVER